ncbi:MAG: IclR family transcriptional regulator [Deltaproteobacteria bacterium]|nr:IclR family transcriptional regulator [Deltaproteobacteria bacterium]
MRQDESKVNAIDKALMILSSFTPHNEEMGTVEISQKLGFHKATVSRILQNLTKRGFLIQNSQTKRFVLGPAVMDLARAMNQSLRSNVVQIAKPFIDTLRDSLKETVILEILSGDTTFMAYIADGPRLVRLAGSMGDRVPIHASAGAKALLAFSPAEVKDRLLNVKLHPFTSYTITDRNRIEQQLFKVRKEGVAFDHEEIDEGTSAIGAPIFNHDSIPIGAVVVAGPTQRIKNGSTAGMVSELKATAAKISTQFHYVSPSV